MHKIECSQFVSLVAETFFCSGQSILKQTLWLSAPQWEEKLGLSDLNAANTFLPFEYVVQSHLRKDVFCSCSFSSALCSALLKMQNLETLKLLGIGRPKAENTS